MLNYIDDFDRSIAENIDPKTCKDCCGKCEVNDTCEVSCLDYGGMMKDFCSENKCIYK